MQGLHTSELKAESRKRKAESRGTFRATPRLCSPSVFGFPLSAFPRRSRSAFRFPLSAFRRTAFTLTELLIVIAIIGVLASLITAAAVNALRNAKRNRIILEMKNITTAIEDFKSQFGAYPPNAMNSDANSLSLVSSDIARMAKKAFPRMNAAEQQVMLALINGNYSTQVVTNANVQGGMNASEALYFWLGGFSDDPQFPLSGPGGPSYDYQNNSERLEDRKARYAFDLGQLAPRMDDDSLDLNNVRYVQYKVDLNHNGNTNDAGEQRQINLWYYRPSGSEVPYVYFDASRYKPYQYDMSAYPAQEPDAPHVMPIIRYREGFNANNPPQLKDFIFANNKKFQIMHPGLDEVWANQDDPQFQYVGRTPRITANTDVKLIFPDGPFTGEIADTLTNFTESTLEDAQEE